MQKEEMTSDELEIIEGWRLVKQHRKGYIHAILQSQGHEFYLEITPAKQGKVIHNRFFKENP